MDYLIEDSERARNGNGNGNGIEKVSAKMQKQIRRKETQAERETTA